MIILGFYNDYYIIVSTQHLRNLPFPKRKFYWANESFAFSPIPEVRKSEQAFLSSLNDYFTGEHDRILQESQSNHDDLNMEDDDSIFPITKTSY